MAQRIKAVKYLECSALTQARECNHKRTRAHTPEYAPALIRSRSTTLIYAVRERKRGRSDEEGGWCEKAAEE
jgi:hypothetical protein